MKVQRDYKEFRLRDSQLVGRLIFTGYTQGDFKVHPNLLMIGNDHHVY